MADVRGGLKTVISDTWYVLVRLFSIVRTYVGLEKKEVRDEGDASMALVGVVEERTQVRGSSGEPVIGCLICSIDEDPPHGDGVQEKLCSHVALEKAGGIS